MFVPRRSQGEREGAVWSPGKTNLGKLEAGDEAWHCWDVFSRLLGAGAALGDASDFCCSRLGRRASAEMPWGWFVFWKRCMVLKAVMHRVQTAAGFPVRARIRAVVVLMLLLLQGDLCGGRAVA